MLDVTDKNLVVMQEKDVYQSPWIIYESHELAKKLLAMDNGHWNWIGYIFDGWELQNVEEFDPNSIKGQSIHRIYTYLDKNKKNKYIHEIECYPNEYNRADETYYIRKVYNEKPVI